MYTNTPWTQEQYEDVFNDLLEGAWNRLETQPELGGLLALHTLSGHTYWSALSGKFFDGDCEGGFQEEEAAIQALIEHRDTGVACILNMYRNRTHPEEPSQPMVASWYFSERLTEIDPRNWDAMVLLWGGGETYGYKPLWVTMPPGYQEGKPFINLKEKKCYADAQQEAEAETLITLTREQVVAHPECYVVIGLRSAKGNVHFVVDSHMMLGDYRDEQSGLQMLVDKDDTEITLMVCMFNEKQFEVTANWTPRSVDISSSRFNLGLIAINPKNEYAQIILNGGPNIYLIKYLKDVLPPKKEL